MESLAIFDSFVSEGNRDPFMDFTDSETEAAFMFGGCALYACAFVARHGGTFVAGGVDPCDAEDDCVRYSDALCACQVAHVFVSNGESFFDIRGEHDPEALIDWQNLTPISDDAMVVILETWYLGDSESYDLASYAKFLVERT